MVPASVATIVAVGLLVGAPRGVAADPSAAARKQQMESVIREWSARLNAGDNAGLAGLYALPAVIIQAPYAYRIPTRALVAKWYSTLPCSGRIVSITVRRRYATAVFTLGNRGKSHCDAPPGTLAAARFGIVGGKIVSWEQVPVPAKKAPTGPVA